MNNYTFKRDFLYVYVFKNISSGENLCHNREMLMNN